MTHEKATNGMEQGTPRQLPKTDWVILAEICAEKQVDMNLIIRPEKYRDDISAAKRASVLREARAKGISWDSLTTLCPMSERGMRKAMFKRNSSAFSSVTFPS